MEKQKNKKEYVALRLRLAEDKIKAASILFDNQSYRDAISRAYYAVFYAAKALLLAHGQDPCTHKGVDILFYRFCRDHGKPSVASAKIFSSMRHARLEADYEEKITVTKEDAAEALKMASFFVKEIKSLIKRQ